MVLLLFCPPLISTLFPYTTLFRSLAAGRTAGVFQLDGAGMTRVVQDIGPENLNDLSAAVALYRRSEEHTSELQSRFDLVCRLLLEKKKRMSILFYLQRICKH